MTLKVHISNELPTTTGEGRTEDVAPGRAGGRLCEALCQPGPGDCARGWTHGAGGQVSAGSQDDHLLHIPGAVLGR